MTLIWVLLLAAAAVSSTNGAATANGGSRIVGGEATTITSYPSLVAVEYRYSLVLWYQTCAGTIISPQYVLSVAHCFTGIFFSINQRRIRAGTTTRNSGGLIKGIKSAMNHPTFGKNGHDGDITILHLESRFTFDNSIGAAFIPRQGLEMFDNAPVTHAGWGTTKVGGGGSKATELHHVKVSTINHALCVKHYEQLSRSSDVTENMICSGVLNVGEKDVCEGDEGGPMYFNNDILVGIVSWGQNCANAVYPSVNTKVSAFSDWILLNITP